MLVLLLILIIALIVAAFIYFDAQTRVMHLLEWIDQLGMWGPVLFVILDMLVVVLVLPGVLLTLGAGFLFGVFWGSLYVVMATTLGATIAFLIARHLLGERAARYILQHPKVQILNNALGNSGWKFVLLTRLIPFFPFKPANYVFGLAKFRLRDFFIGTLFGISPFTLTNVYIGSIAADLATLGAGRAPRTPWQWGMYAVGLAVAVAALIYITRTAKRILAEETKKQEQEEV
jgi:uncharacterized membrane protein YdjX (TVP38/TMEM64 family)